MKRYAAWFGLLGMVLALFGQPVLVAAEGVRDTTLSPSISQASAKQNLPELTINQYRLTSFEVAEGDAFHIIAIISNAGTVTAGPSHIKLFFSPGQDYDTSDDFWVSPEQSVPELVAGASAEIRWDFNFPNILDQVPTYSVWAVFQVDSQNEVTEEIEANLFSGNSPITVTNTQSLTATFTPTPQTTPAPSPTSDSDLAGSVGVNHVDLFFFATEWGNPGQGKPADLDQSGRIGSGDLLVLLRNWGTGVSGAVFTPGQEVILVNQTIGSDGGTITGPSQSPIEGISVEFEAGSLPGNTPVQLGYNTGSLQPVRGTAAPVVLTLHTGDAKNFEQPVRITFPFAPGPSGHNIPVPYYLDSQNRLQLASLTEVNRTNHTATFETFHASDYTWILEDFWESLGGQIFRTGFIPSEDGFQVPNNGSAYNRGGECFGMTSFALWYFENHLWDGIFYPRFMDEIGTSGLKGQDLIATRSFISIGQQWNTYLPTTNAQLQLSEIEQRAVVRNALKNTISPVLIYLSQKNGPDAHSVLSYGYISDPSPTYTEFMTYDPNYPGVVKLIRFDEVKDEWVHYEGYDEITYNGDGSLNLTEPYGYILADAEADFHSSKDAVITITSHKNEEEVPDRMTTLKGTIDSGEVAVTRLKVYVNSTPFSTPLAYDGTFSLEIPVDVGDNFLVFETMGLNDDSQLIPLNNNMVEEKFKLVGTSEAACILVTLTWSTNNTDLDLYVIDPTGDYSYYDKPDTADGGQLDNDVTTGYGPEHWTLTYQDTIRWDEDYRVRVHYYDDDNEEEVISSNFNVSIMLYETTDRQTTTTYSGNLTVSNPYNDGPLATGADWRDVAIVRPVQPQVGKSEQPSVRPVTYEDGLPVISVPVADPEVRRRSKVARD